MLHNRKSRNRYRSFPKDTTCAFCDPNEIKGRIIRETKHAYIIPNRVSYDFWEAQGVKEHLMVIPKQHVKSLSELPDAHLLDIIKLVAEYESHDYNVYARAVRSKTRSVTHQHTHLLKLDHKPARFSLFLRKPYFLLKF
ncbi:MAG: hypothetical protein JWN38_463 [Candidatus Saccharibacteria bacterium]|nr:hypothetical protein [Candidatus Saccharibacteria bacterium]